MLVTSTCRTSSCMAQVRAANCRAPRTLSPGIHGLCACVLSGSSTRSHRERKYFIALHAPTMVRSRRLQVDNSCTDVLEIRTVSELHCSFDMAPSWEHAVKIVEASCSENFQRCALSIPGPVQMYAVAVAAVAAVLKKYSIKLERNTNIPRSWQFPLRSE